MNDDEPARAPETFGRMVRRLRLAKRWSQEELAAYADISAATISIIERGRGPAPHLKTVGRIATAFQLTDQEADTLFSAAAQIKKPGITRRRILVGVAGAAATVTIAATEMTVVSRLASMFERVAEDITKGVTARLNPLDGPLPDQVSCAGDHIYIYAVMDTKTKPLWTMNRNEEFIVQNSPNRSWSWGVHPSSGKEGFVLRSMLCQSDDPKTAPPLQKADSRS